MIPSSPSRRGRRILVVEDEFILALALEHSLLDEGAIVWGPVTSVSKALAMIEAKGVPDGAILNIELGGERSYPLAQELRRRGIPFAFASSLKAEQVDPLFRDVLLVSKPVRLASLTSMFQPSF